MVQSLGESAFWILTALAGGRLHGYAIVQQTAVMSGEAVKLKPTTLYAALERLESDRLVRQDGDEVVDGRTRRYYCLTDAGADRLAVEATALASKADVARSTLARFRPAAGPA